MEKRDRYAKPEFERRFLLESLPTVVFGPVRIRDRYLQDTRIRLRRIESMEGELIELKLGHKWRPHAQDPRVIMHTSIYLDDTEFELLSKLAGNDLVKTRYRLEEQPNWAIDHHKAPRDGLIILEVNFADVDKAEEFEPPAWASVEVTDDEEYTGDGLARS
ncbi:MAG: hypothetical protein ACRDVL_02075 [Acidimicrobiia bacterium]